MSTDQSKSKQRGRRFLLATLAWGTFFVSWALFMLGYVGIALQNALISSGIATLVSAIMSVAVWKFTGRLRWPDQISATFFGIHVAVAAAFTLVWTAFGPVVGILADGGGFDRVAEISWTIEEFGWRMLLGVWLYSIIAGISYAIRNSARLSAQKRLAEQASLESVAARAAASDARLKSLRSQLKPHFLFNALHSVSALIHESPDDAETALEQIGDLLRYAVKERTGELVSVAEEWSFCLAYVELQKIRFGDQLQVDASVDQEVMGQAIPVFSIQPLIENAIRHGALSSAEQATLTVGIQLEGANLVIRVVDNGTIRDGSEGGSEGGSTEHAGITSTGTGLSALRERLASLYETFSLELFSDKEGNSNAELIIPAQSE